jgi:Arc/MetJ-type ribon-helix-helix transcriptional regulator
MGEKVQGRVDTQTADALERMVEDGVADNESEALRRALHLGLAEDGYLDGKESETDLRQTARSLGFVLAMVGSVFVGLALFGPLRIRLLAITPWVMAVGCYGLDRILVYYEPSLSARLGLLGGEKV